MDLQTIRNKDRLLKVLNFISHLFMKYHFHGLGQNFVTMMTRVRRQEL